MEGLARTGRMLGMGLVVAGFVGEFCLYDGMENLYIISIIIYVHFTFYVIDMI